MIALRAVEDADGDALHAIFTEPGVRRYLFDDRLLTRAETQQHVEAACAHAAWVILSEGAVAGLVLSPNWCGDIVAGFAPARSDAFTTLIWLRT